MTPVLVVKLIPIPGNQKNTKNVVGLNMVNVTINKNLKIRYLVRKFLSPHKSYLHSLWPYVLVSALIFVFGIIAGYYVTEIFPSRSQEMISLLKKTYEPILETGTFSQILFVFLKNGIASFLIIITGVIFGIIPVISLIDNGGILGMVSTS